MNGNNELAADAQDSQHGRQFETRVEGIDVPRVSAWFADNIPEVALPLQVHFDLKAFFDLPEAVMTDNTIEFHAPVRLGDVLRTHQVLRSVSEEKTTKLGTGRFWVIDVIYANQSGDLVAVESYTGFGYRREAP